MKTYISHLKEWGSRNYINVLFLHNLLATFLIFVLIGFLPPMVYPAFFCLITLIATRRGDCLSSTKKNAYVLATIINMGIMLVTFVAGIIRIFAFHPTTFNCVITPLSGILVIMLFNLLEIYLARKLGY